MGTLVTFSGLSVFVSLIVAVLAPTRSPTPESRKREAVPSRVRLLAVGDINLGRNVGQRILAGDLMFPFELVADDLHSYDIVIGNLECPLSDQQGETQHPGNNLIFTGPPSGAASLRLGGITAVSTANNHALDYGVRGMRETRQYLEAEEVLFAGTGESEEDLFRPAMFTVKGIRFAFFSCTAIMNIEDRIWTRYVAEADSAKLFPVVRSFRHEVDMIILGYHGGAEYASEPGRETREFARAAVDAGVDLFLGHHPHVPQRIEQRGTGLIVYSLGNFVFRQPFDLWTQRSFALEIAIDMEEGGAALRWYHPRPVTAGDQPSFGLTAIDLDALQGRIAGVSDRKGDAPEWFN